MRHYLCILLLCAGCRGVERVKYEGFIGGSYELDSKVADCQRTINLVPEINQSGSGKL